MIGQRLGPYEITAKLGAGGMGEVYRATDTKLKRDVAIKVLPVAFTEDRERLARFEREAQLLAQLQHPNIAAIYGLEESAGTRALVMELVEGPTLAERLAEGSLPFDECLAVAVQIAQALEEAHEKGIVHRDLKPQNIKSAVAGKAKVLDFGLAKAMDPTAGAAPSTADLVRSPTLMQSPTLTAAAIGGGTQLGVILGTAAYMAPEQARGVGVDKRADIWAFGVVLFEMLTGRRLFEGELVTDVLANVLKKDVAFEALPAETPPPIRRLLRRCLERNPKNRLHDIADARIVLEEVAARKPDLAPAAAESVAPWRRRLPWIVAAAAATVAIGALALVVAGRSGPPAGASLFVDLGAPEKERFQFQGDFGAPAVLSRDGGQVAFGATGADSKTRLWVRSLATGVARRLDATAGASAPFFSPDGRSLGYFAAGKLLTVSIDGGTPLNLADAPNGRGGAWALDGTIVFAPNFRSGLFRVRASGGQPEPVTALDESRHSTHRWPVLTPDGGAVVYLATNHEGAKQSGSELRWVRLDGTGDRALVPALANGAAVGDRLLYLRERTLLAQPFDAARGELGGEPAVVAQGVLYDPSTWRATFSAGGGRLLFSPAGGSLGSRVGRYDRSGRLIEELTPEGVYAGFALSPDGKRLAIERAFPSDLWLLDLERQTFGRFTFEATDEIGPVWSRDGRWIYYSMVGIGAPDRIYRKSVGGAGTAELVWESAADIDALLLDLTPDGRQLLLAIGSFPFYTTSDLALLDLAAQRLTPVVSGPGIENDGRISPDGRWIAHSSSESGVFQVYVSGVPGVAGVAGAGSARATRWQVSVNEGARPLWSADGRELVYLEPSLNLSRVSVAEDGTGGLVFGVPEQVFATTLLADAYSFALAPDGQSLILNQFGEAQSRPLRLIENWRTLLPR